MNIPDFDSRWIIRGLLTTRSELHCGDGGVGEVYDRTRPKRDDPDESDASTVCVDHRGRAFIPGSSIKGVLRARIAALLEQERNALDAWRAAAGRGTPPPPTPWTDLFGLEPASGTARTLGGKLSFFDAFHTQAPDAALVAARAACADGCWNRLRLETSPQDDRQRPFWDPIRCTCVAVANSLDRRLRTSKDNLLYHLEYVPPGQSFQVEVAGENLTREQVGLLLRLLESFNAPSIPRTTLGALESAGWGTLDWTQPEVHRLTVGNLAGWVTHPRPGFAACTEAVPFASLMQQVANPLSSTPNLLTIALTLTLESPWLVRDPRQRDRAELAAGQRRRDASVPKACDAVPLFEEQTRVPFVPAKSLRGALRARAEMILRTLDKSCADHPDQLPAVTTKRQKSAGALHQVGQTDLAAKLFGLSGWRAPLRVPRLLAVAPPGTLHQEFVAVDRVTGGAADRLKFDADLARQAVLTGTLVVDLDRLAHVDSTFACLGLLALVLRDLAEGDVALGSGPSKGQGSCTATAQVHHGTQHYRTLDEWFVSDQVTEAVAAFQSSR